MKSLMLGAIAVIALGAVTANAADMLPAQMPLKAPFYHAPPLWTGFHVGVNGGYGFGGSAEATVVPGALFPPGSMLDPATTAPFGLKTSPSGGVFGIQAGYNMQSGNLVAGLEADINWSGIKDSQSGVFTAGLGAVIAPVMVTGSATLEEKLDYFGTARARLGYLVSDRLLPYVTAGFAWGKTEVSLSGAVTGPGGTVVATDSSDKTRWGYSAGAGFDWAWSSNWSMRGEYLFLHLNQDVALALPAATATSNGMDEHILRLGLNYRLWR